MLAYVQSERARVLASVAAMDALQGREEAFTRAGIAASDALYTVHRAFEGAPPAELAAQLAALQAALARLPAAQARLRELRAAQADYGRARDRVGLYALREALTATAREVEAGARGQRDRHAALSEDIRATYERISARTLALGLAGLALFGAATAAFFARISAQLGRLRERAARIVQGYRGPPLASRRGDEVGELSRAVDRMAADLAERERRLELGLRRQVHAERMATVGAMAAKVAHEIGNPLAVISGLAQEIAAGAAGAAQAHLIVGEAERVAGIARQMSVLAGGPREPGASVALDAAAASAVELLRFDPRLHHQPIALEAARGLPPAHGDAGELIHVLVSLVLALLEAGGAGRVDVRTGREGERLFVRVSAAPAADAPALQGFADSGKIALARQIAAEMQARLDLEADPPGACLWLRPAQPVS